MDFVVFVVVIPHIGSKSQVVRNPQEKGTTNGRAFALLM